MEHGVVDSGLAAQASALIMQLTDYSEANVDNALTPLTIGGAHKLGIPGALTATRT